jgi:hypothetical protein
MARTAGVFYLLEGAASAFGAIHVVSQVTVSGNATATAASVLDHQALMWAGFGLALVALAAFGIYLVFFGLWLTLIGYLIVRSAFIPAVVGVLAMCGGVCYLTLLAPPLAGYLYPWYLAPDSLWSLRQQNGFSGAIMNAGPDDRRRSAGGPREGAGNAWNRCGRGWLTQLRTRT